VCAFFKGNIMTPKALALLASSILATSMVMAQDKPQQSCNAGTCSKKAKEVKAEANCSKKGAEVKPDANCSKK
jgi:hypothetical protein